MIFKQLNDDACKTYFIADEKTKEAVLIDPVIVYTDKYIEYLKDNGLKLTHVIDTHTHADHISAGPSLVKAIGCDYVMFEKAPAKCVTVRVSEGDTLEAAGQEFKFLHTPGHTRDSLSMITGNLFFTGDFLFLDDGGAGRDDLPGGDPAAHWDSFQKLNDLPDELMVYPAHDYRDRKPTKLKKQKAENPHLKSRTKNEFVTYLQDLKLGPAEWMADVLKANYSCSTDPDAAYIPKDSPACEVMGTLDPALENISVDYISFSQLADKLNKSKPTIIDVREAYELNDELGHIEGVVNMPMGHLMAKIHKSEILKDADIVLVCRSGARAETAARELVNDGYTNVSVLMGGMIAWRESGN
jgi:glyoxylase-like metal-dependent hydrolase (beta-lactamase superfamily II)/rhodanese-related sulfurtransferase